MVTSTDRIEKSILLNVPRSRVWRAIASANEFSQWFGVKLEGQFAPGARVSGKITTPGYEHLTMEIVIEQVQPEDLFTYRWHPYAIDPSVDYSGEPMTLVEFRLVQVEGGTQLTVVESGFDQIPLERREEAFRMNEGGWTAQVQNIARHVSG